MPAPGLPSPDELQETDIMKDTWGRVASRVSVTAG